EIFGSTKVATSYYNITIPVRRMERLFLFATVIFLYLLLPLKSFRDNLSLQTYKLLFSMPKNVT
ncbi:MAG: hypothetical protein WCZ85_06030, partial [Bacilli bacterium]